MIDTTNSITEKRPKCVVRQCEEGTYGMRYNDARFIDIGPTGTRKEEAGGRQRSGREVMQ